MAATAPSPLTLKVEFRGEIRRLHSWPADDEEASATEPALRAAALSLFQLQEGAGGSDVRITYRDAEGDACSLAPETLEDALAHANGSGVLRLHLEVLPRQRAAVEQPDRSPGSHATGRAAAGLREGVCAFGRQLCGDWRGADADFKQAVRFKGDMADDGFVKTVAATAAGAAVGAAVAVRFAPVRFAKLAAQGAATALGRRGAAGTEPLLEPQEEPREQEPATVEGEVQHFAGQVGRDFCSARQDVRAAFGYFAKPRPAAEVGAEPAQAEETAPSSCLGKAAVPEVAAAAAGVAVAVTLVPLRALRLAVASAAVAVAARPRGAAPTEAAVAGPAAAGDVQ